MNPVRFVVAITDSVFPSLDPERQVLGPLGADSGPGSVDLKTRSSRSPRKRTPS